MENDVPAIRTNVRSEPVRDAIGVAGSLCVAQKERDLRLVLVDGRRHLFSADDVLLHSGVSDTTL